MREKYVLVIITICILFFGKVQVNAIEISQDTVITESIHEGIEVSKDCKITFQNDKEIHIGSINNTCPGISVQNGVTLTIDVKSNKNVNVYGGYYEEQDNEYDCAGIYVPSNATLIIENTKDGELVIYPFGIGAGIGGNGVFIEKFVNNIKCPDAGSIILKFGKVTVKNPVMKQEDALGAKIGGGGIYNVSDDVECLFGGNLRSFKMINGELTLISESEEQQKGVGAIIGGGGIYNYNEYIEIISGGNAEEIYIYGGTIDVHNKNKDLHKGAGAIIGGGGIFNCSTVDNIIKGQIFLKEIKSNAKIKLSEQEPICGDGNIYSNGVCIKGGNQVQNVPKSIDRIASKILSGLIDTIFICSGIFLTIELVS